MNLLKGHNSVKTVGGVTVLILCTSLDSFIEYISKGFRVIELT